jgi:hypothetical protein
MSNKADEKQNSVLELYFLTYHVAGLAVTNKIRMNSSHVLTT